MEKKNIFSYSLETLRDLLVKDFNATKFRSTQIFTWLYKKKVYDFFKMSDVSKDFQKTLDDNFSLELPKIKQVQESKDGTIKILVELTDGNLIESVIMFYRYGNALCVSSEVGCNNACAFCASSLTHKIRKLETSEMVGQVLLANQILEEKKKGQISHIVVMGIGEPFANFENVTEFIRILNDPKGFEIGARHISVSTSGLVPEIKKFADLNTQINLAISLHASNNKTRDELMPINKKYPLKDLIEAIKYYTDKTNRLVTLEYIMLKDVNDSIKDAQNLFELFKDNKLVFVNLIPYNKVSGKPFEQTKWKDVKEFSNTLMRLGIKTTIRKEFGSDIDASCGQLRYNNLKNK